MRDEMLPAEAWTQFLSEIEAARRRLHCSESAAWFRGHSNSSWHLVPSVFRFGTASDPDDAAELRRRAQAIKIERDKWQKLLREKTNLKSALSKVRRDSPLQERYREASDSARLTRNSFVAMETALLRFQVSVNGERELFDEYVFRAGKSDSYESWKVLAEMRHHGVPTRLLDWTDRLDIALYFALDQYCDQQDGASSSPPLLPCIWVLNPFRLSRRASNRTAIWNITHHPELDYYHRFHRTRDWPFDEPLPIFPPVAIERIRSQRGYFTVFGNNKAPLDVQLKSGLKCLEKVSISSEAANFCIDYLSRVQGLSPFEVFRDLDSLGKELTARFAKIQRETEHRIATRAQQGVRGSPNGFSPASE
jgi:FRG domain